MPSRMERLTSVSQIVSALGVLLTLVLLVVSVRENTATIRAAAAAASRDALASMNDYDRSLSDSDIELLLRASDPAMSWQNLSDVERFKVTAAQRSFFRRAEAQYFRHRHGLLDDDAWQTVRHRVWANIASPIEKKIWERDRSDVYTRGFVEAVESYQPQERAEK